jgi:xanthine dehydrogenase small subunit
MKSGRSSMSPIIRFLLNNQEIETREHPGMLVLDYLRRQQKLMGTKEGCKEGDCGACTVLIGEIEGDGVSYKPVTSCLMPLGELQGKHLVTIEGLNMPELTPVQQAIVNKGATQCGFCTPAIAVSLTGFLMQEGAKTTPEGIKYALSGHLCRCTGYRSLKHSQIHLKKSVNGKTGIKNLVAQKMLPEYFLNVPERLKKIPPNGSKNGKHKSDIFIAGGTDIYIQKGEIIPDSNVNILNLHPEMKGISKENGQIRVGALTTFEEFANHPEIQKIIPHIRDYIFLIASWQIRNRATLGGNVINASPIGDMTILLLALECHLVLKNGKKERTVPMTSFYKGYKDLAKSSNELLTQIIIPKLSRDAKIDWEKVSKRKCLDIASVNSAICIRYDRDVIKEVGLAIGGVAPVPLFMKNTTEYLIGKSVSKETLIGGIEAAQREISPISDVRGSAEYKRLLVRQLLISHFCKLFPEKLRVGEIIS